jgi:muramoyltetrapeptide carboxypeptidase LdcA involved in peptidoglycan recycling
VVDRTMKYFMRIGKMDHIKAVVFGDMLAGRFSHDEVEQRHQELYMEKVLKRLAEQFDVPVFTTRYVGHGFYQAAISMGPMAQLQCGLQPYLAQCVD